MSRLHPERHFVSRIGWLRAAILGANDGIVSTTSLISGVAAASAQTSEGIVTLNWQRRKIGSGLMIRHPRPQLFSR